MTSPAQGPISRRDRSSDLSVSPVTTRRELAPDARPSPPPPLGTRDRSYPRRRSSPRLAGFDYAGGHRYHVVVVTHDRTRAFDNPDWGTRAVDSLLTTAAATGFDLDAYCVMPDHLHFLATGHAEEGTDLRAFVHRFKQKLGFAYKQLHGRTLWQRSYYEHVLRSDESLEPYVAYVLGNPVNAGLVETVGQWPHSGPPELLARSGEADRSEDLSLRMNALIAGIEREMDSTEHGPDAAARATHKDRHHA